MVVSFHGSRSSGSSEFYSGVRFKWVQQFSTGGSTPPTSPLVVTVNSYDLAMQGIAVSFRSSFRQFWAVGG